VSGERTVGQPRVASFGNRRYGQNVLETTRIPLTIDSQWQSKTVTTDPPTYVPHLEWVLGFTITAAEALRLAVVVESRTDVAWGLVSRDPSASPRVEVKFLPYAWTKSDDVQVNFEWQRVTVTDPQLKDDPRRVVAVVAPARAETASRIPVATLPSHGLTLAMILLAARDTEHRRQGRWRLKPELAEAIEPYGPVLASGHQAGTATA